MKQGDFTSVIDKFTCEDGKIYGLYYMFITLTSHILTPFSLHYYLI